MFKKPASRWWSKLAISGVLLSFILTTGCAQLQKAVEEAIQKIQAGKSTELTTTTGEVVVGGQVFYQTSSGGVAGVDYASVVVTIGATSYYGNSDSIGYFNIPVGSLASQTSIKVSASKGGYGTSSITVELGTGKQYTTSSKQIDVSVKLTKEEGALNTGTIRGRIYYGPLPIPDSTITILSGAVTGSTKANQNGDYILTGLKAGSYTLQISRTGFTTKTSSTLTLTFPNTMILSDQDFELQPVNTQDYNIEGLGVIYVKIVPPGSTTSTEDATMPPFITEATATLVNVEGTGGKAITTFINRSDLTFKFFGIPVGTYEVDIQLTVDQEKLTAMKAYLTTQEFKILKHRYGGILSQKTGTGGTLPSVQKLTVKETDFDFKSIMPAQPGGPQFGFDTIWIEQEVRIKIGDQDRPLSGAKIKFKRNLITKEIQTNMFGWFGLNLPEEGVWTMEVYSKPADTKPVFTQEVTIKRFMITPRSWWAGFIFIEGTVSDIATDVKKVIHGKLKKAAQYPLSDNYTQPITLVFYSVKVPSYQVTVNAVNGEFKAEVAPLGDFKVRIVSGNVTLQNKEEMFFVDPYSFDAFRDIWLRDKGIQFKAKIFAKFGNTELGVPVATVSLKKGLINPQVIASANTGAGGFSGEAGRFTLSIPEDNLEGQDYVFEVTKSGVINPLSISTWFKFDPLFVYDNWYGYNSNLKNLFDIKVRAISYFGPKFPVVKGKITTDSHQQSKVQNAVVKLAIAGADISVTGNSDSNGNFILNNVPGIDAELELSVTKGSDVGKTDWTFRFDWRDINNLKDIGETYFSETDVWIPWGNASNPFWIQFKGFVMNDLFFKVKYNQREFSLPGVTLNLTLNSNSAVSTNRSSDDSGSIRGLFIPEDAGIFTVTLTKPGYTPVDTMNFNNQDLGKSKIINYGWTLGDTFFLKPTGTDVASLVKVLPTTTVSGKVKYGTTNWEGAPVKWKAKHEAFSVTATTNSSGEYSLVLPKIGEYDVTVSINGFIPETRTEWIESGEGSSKSVEFTLKIPGDDGWWSINTWDMPFKVITHKFPNGDVKIHYLLRTKIQRNSENFTQTVANNNKLKAVIVRADTEEVLGEMTYVDLGIWRMTGSSGKTFHHLLGDNFNVFESDKFHNANGTNKLDKIRVQIRTTDTNFVVYPKSTEKYQTEKNVPELREHLTVTVASENSRTKISFNNYWGSKGITNKRYVLKFYAPDKDPDGSAFVSPSFEYHLWIYEYNSTNTVSFHLGQYEWIQVPKTDGTIEWKSLKDLYPTALPTGKWKVDVLYQDEDWTPSAVWATRVEIVDPTY